MDVNSNEGSPGARRYLLPLLLVLAALVRLYHFQAPLVDQLYVKQVYVANKSRGIARALTSAQPITLDFLDDRGMRMQLAEEIPVYPGLLGLGFTLFGEREGLGRVLSILATLGAVAAFHDLLRREFDAETARVGALLLAFSPLLIFYGRAVLPDPAMLACMLTAACAYRRHLDQGTIAWLWAAALAALLGAMFKYYGLMVLIPLADMTRRQGGWQACLGRRFVGLCLVAIVPIALWVGLVFAPTPNPTAKSPYFLFQAPGILLEQRMYQCLLDRFLLRDCGPVVSALIAVGVWAAATRRIIARPIFAWTIMGISFCFLLGPKTHDHDYYELMALPAAAAWAALGWTALWGTARCASAPAAGARRARGVGVLAAAAVIHSPLVMDAKFQLEVGHTILARRLNQVCSPEGRIIVIGQKIGWPVVHYSGREGWVLQHTSLPDDWRRTFARYKALGAEYVGLYIDPTVTSPQRASFRPLTTALRVVEQRSGPWFRKGKTCQYTILSLRDAALGASGPVAGTGAAPATAARSPMRR